MRQKWVLGASTNRDAAGGALNSLANGDAVNGGQTIANSSVNDLYVDFDFRSGTTALTTVAPAYIGIYLYPAFGDDYRFDVAAAGPPAAPYFVGQIAFPVGAQTTHLRGKLRGVVLPAGENATVVVYNQTGTALSASNNQLKYSTYTIGETT